MNPRALAAWSLAGLVVALGSTNPYHRGLVALAGIALLLNRARPGVRLRPIFLLLLTAALGAALINPLLSHVGDDVLFGLPVWIPVAGGSITAEAVVFGFVAGLGIVASALAVAPLSLAIESHDLINALPRFLERTGTAVSASLQLVPGIARSYTAIREGQLLRGWKPGGPAAWGEVLVPTLVTAIEDSVQLAEAMEARAYGSGPRTSFTLPVWRASDTVLLLSAAVVAGGFLLARGLGIGGDWHAYPRLTAPELQPFLAALCLLLFVPVVGWPRSR
jgi:energy-coupling factor transport system permease protein